jgi:hypothetical protein
LRRWVNSGECPRGRSSSGYVAFMKFATEPACWRVGSSHPTRKRSTLLYQPTSCSLQSAITLSMLQSLPRLDCYHCNGVRDEYTRS